MIRIGKYTLDSSQVEKLGTTTNTKVNWSPDDKAILHYASLNMNSAGFGALIPKGTYLISSLSKSEAEHIGQVRV